MAGSHRLGFTLVETLLVMGIVAVLLTISGILVGNLVPRASVVQVSGTLVGEMRQQQLKAMIGETEGSGTQEAYGVVFETQQYILFRGETYTPGAAANVVIPVESPNQLSTTFPTQHVVFAQGSGEIMNFTPGSASVTVTNTATGTSTEIEVNTYGIPIQSN